MSKITELREKCDTLAAEIKRFADKANDKSQEFTAEDEGNFDKLNADYDAARADLTKEEKRDSIGARSREIEDRAAAERAEKRKIGRDDFRGAPSGARGEITDEHRGLALRSWFNSGRRQLAEDEIEVCHRVGIDPYAQEIDLRIATTAEANQLRRSFLQSRALSAHLGSSGGFTIPDGFVNSLELAMLAFGGMREAADILRTETGNTIPYPTSDDTSNTGEIIGESTAVTEQDVTFGAVNLYAHKYSSKMVKVPAELLQDSAFNIPSMLGGLLGERLGRITNTHFTTGDGAAKPRGITTMTTLGVTAAATGAITMDEIIDLTHSVGRAYRTGASFMLSDSTLKAVRKLKNGSGDYLWTQGTQAGQPDRLWNFPYIINDDMAALATGAKTVIFGQLNKYKIREVNVLRLRRLVERYAEYDQEAFVAFARYDGALIDAGAHPVKHLIQA